MAEETGVKKIRASLAVAAFALTYAASAQTSGMAQTSLQGHATATPREYTYKGVVGDLPQLATYGLHCVREGANPLPAKVKAVDIYSRAFKKGLVAGDRILSASADKAGYVLTVERHGQRYSADLRDPRIGPLEADATIVSSGLNKLTSMPSATSRIMQPAAAVSSARGGILHPFSPADIARDGISGIKQGRYGNCWFEASLGALALTQSGQRQLSDDIVSPQPGEYAVTLPGLPGTVNISDADIDRMNLVNPARWASVIECAERTARPNNEDSQGAAYGQPAIKLGLEILTGRPVRFLRPSDVSAGELSQLLSQLTNSGTPAVIATKSPRENGQAMQLISPNHAYTVIAYNSGNGAITLRNPHGIERHSSTASAAFGNAGTGDPGPYMDGSGDQGLITLDMNTFVTFVRFLAFPEN